MLDIEPGVSGSVEMFCVGESDFGLFFFYFADIFHAQKA